MDLNQQSFHVLKQDGFRFHELPWDNAGKLQRGMDAVRMSLNGAIAEGRQCITEGGCQEEHAAAVRAYPHFLFYPVPPTQGLITLIASPRPGLGRRLVYDSPARALHWYNSGSQIKFQKAVPRDRLHAVRGMKHV